MTRKEYILHVLREHNRVTVEELSQTLNVSPITIRRDLKELERKGLLSRVRGGASLAFGDGINQFSKKEQLNIIEKQKIALKLGKLIPSNSIAFTNGGTTTATCLEKIESSNVTIFTNNAVAISTQVNPNLQIQYLGGILDMQSKTFHGDIAQLIIGTLRADICIVGTNGISIENGISSHSFEESLLNKKMINRTLGKVIVVADYSKINAISNFEVCAIDEIDILITDKKCPKSFVQKLLDMNIEVHIV